MRTQMKARSVAAAILTLGAATWMVLGGLQATGQEKAPPARRPTDIQPTKKTLFDRLGGTYAIAAVMDAFTDALARDAVVMGNPQTRAAVDKALAEHGLPGLKFQITAFVIEAAGGPYKYKGRTMKESHRHLKITEAEWQAGVAVLKATLERFRVPSAEQAELLAIVASTHDDIVTASVAGAEKP